MKSTDYAALFISRKAAVITSVVVTSVVTSHASCEAWMPTIKKHNNRRTVQQQTAKVRTIRRNNGTEEDRNAPITADLRDINGAV